MPPGGLALQVRLSTDTTIQQQRASVDQSFDFDLSNTGTIRLLRESCGEVNINAEGIQIKGRGRSAGRGRGGSPSDTHYKVSARDICEFQVRVQTAMALPTYILGFGSESGDGGTPLVLRRPSRLSNDLSRPSSTPQPRTGTSKDPVSSREGPRKSDRKRATHPAC